ncbi:MAG: PP2C family protein-serine/threonine phosphatase [Acidobacteria bacterium]|nr:PP2C family protein-serine/threonine phosphatase [Acidobacteriota bacterium]
MDTRLDASRLESLLESAKLLSSSLELEDQLRHLMRTVMGRLLATRGLIALAEGGGFKIAIARGLSGVKAGDEFDPSKAAQLNLALVRPLGEGETPVGYIAAGQPMRPDWATDDAEKEFLEALLSLAEVSIANARAHGEVISTNRALDQKVQELRALIDLVRGVSATIDAEEVAQLLMLTISGRWVVRRHGLVTWKAGQPEIERLKGVEAARVQEWKEALGESAAPVRTSEFVLFPIRSGEQTNGLVALGERLTKLPYTDGDLEFCSGLVAQASVALDNAWHFRDTLYRQQLEKELTLAASIQQDLFPKSLPKIAGADLAARNRQARQVGGDYYDVIGSDGAQFLCVADVAGKGIYASLLMANLQATLRALIYSYTSLPELAARTNDLLWASTPGNKYATAIVVRYDAATGACEYVNGGHSDGIVLRAGGEVEMLGTTGLPVGLFPKREYESKRFELGHGDVLMLYSDGVTDACTVEEEEFGVERTVEVLRAHAGKPAKEIEEKVFESIDEFVAGAPQFDDITVMVLKRE